MCEGDRAAPRLLCRSLVNEPRCEVWAAPNCTAAVQVRDSPPCWRLTHVYSD